MEPEGQAADFRFREQRTAAETTATAYEKTASEEEEELGQAGRADRTLTMGPQA